MSLSFSIDGEHSDYILKRDISIRGAAACTSYSIQYLRRLLRCGALQGTKIGQVWLVDLDDWEHYFDLAQKRNDRHCGPRKIADTIAEADRMAEVVK